MFCHKCKCCNFSWLSGFFALAAIVHLIRLITGMQVQIGGWAVPMNVSIGVAVIAGVLSLILCKKSCASCGCSGVAKT
mgnify:FL=1